MTSRISNEETASIFKMMSSDITLPKRGKRLYGIIGPGVWLLHGHNANHLRTLKASKAIYVPLASIDMFIKDTSLTQMKYDQSKEMILAFHYNIPDEKVSSYKWTKV